MRQATRYLALGPSPNPFLFSFSQPAALYLLPAMPTAGVLSGEVQVPELYTASHGLRPNPSASLGRPPDQGARNGPKAGTFGTGTKQNDGFGRGLWVNASTKLPSGPFSIAYAQGLAALRWISTAF